MAGSNLGDIVVSLGIDSRKWYEEAAALGNSAKGLGGKIHEGLSSKGSLVVDTLSSTISGGLGGATGTVTTALDSYLSRFGALGAAAGVFASVGVAAVVAGLERENRAFQQAGDSVGTVTTRLDAFIGKQREMAAFASGIGRIDTTAGSDRSLSDLDTRISGATGLDKTLAAEARGIERDLATAREALAVSRINEDENFFTSLLGFEDATVPFKKAVDELTAKLDAVTSRRAANAVGLGTAQDQRALLLEERSNIEMRSRSGEAQRIREADPFLSAQTRIEKIRGLVDSEFLERGVGAASARRIFGDFQRSVSPDVTGLRNEGNVAGTSSAFSALQASLRQDRASTEGMTDTARQQLDTLNKILEALTGKSADEPPGEDV